LGTERFAGLAVLAETLASGFFKRGVAALANGLGEDLAFAWSLAGFCIFAAGAAVLPAAAG
jgi:hypothetical protein